MAEQTEKSALRTHGSKILDMTYDYGYVGSSFLRDGPPALPEGDAIPGAFSLTLKRSSILLRGIVSTK